MCYFLLVSLVWVPTNFLVHERAGRFGMIFDKDYPWGCQKAGTAIDLGGTNFFSPPNMPPGLVCIQSYREVSLLILGQLLIDMKDHICPVDKNRSTTGGQSGPPYLQLWLQQEDSPDHASWVCMHCYVVCIIVITSVMAPIRLLSLVVPVGKVGKWKLATQTMTMTVRILGDFICLGYSFSGELRDKLSKHGVTHLTYIAPDPRIQQRFLHLVQPGPKRRALFLKQFSCDQVHQKQDLVEFRNGWHGWQGNVRKHPWKFCWLSIFGNGFF